MNPFIPSSWSGKKGLEPLAFGFGNHYSTIETIFLYTIKPKEEKCDYPLLVLIPSWYNPLGGISKGLV